MSEIRATPKETVEAMLERSKRPKRAVPIRMSFLQTKDSAGKTTGPGPFAQFVKNGDETGFDLNLLVRAVASGEDEEHGYTVRLSAKTWSRAMGHCRSTISPAGISKVWSRLEERAMITRARAKRFTAVTVLREDGSGEPYSHPAKEAEEGRPPTYLQLPFEYWLDDHSDALTFPGKTMLLVALSLPIKFPLPVERAPKWYGFSADTAARGFRELESAGLITKRRDRKPEPLAPEGWTWVNTYTLQPPFDRIKSRAKPEDADS